MDAITQANRDGHFKGILTVTQAYHLECHNMVSFYNGWPQWSLKGTPLQSLCLLYSPVRFPVNTLSIHEDVYMDKTGKYSTNTE